MLHSLLQFSSAEMTETLKEYHFDDEQIDFLMRIVRDNAQYEDDEVREWMEELANQIEDQIVNHPTND
jgi:hypothetical protein